MFRQIPGSATKCCGVNNNEQVSSPKVIIPVFHATESGISYGDISHLAREQTSMRYKAHFMKYTIRVARLALR